MDENPYQAPAVESAQRAVDPMSTGIVRTKMRWVTVGMFCLPALLAPAVSYWVFNVAGTWFVSATNRGNGYLLLMAAIYATLILPALLVLYLDHYRRTLTGLLMVPAAILFMFALIFWAEMILAYFN